MPIAESPESENLEILQTVGLIRDVGVSIMGAAAMGVPAYLMRVPLLLAYISAGVLLGPHLGFRIIESSESISALSSIGLILLMFILGIEIDIRKLGHAGRSVIIAGIFQFLGCVALAWFFFASMEFQAPYELHYLLFTTALSSTLVVVKILSDHMELDSLHSRITLGILLLQDLWAIVFLSVQPNMTQLEPQIFLFSIGRATLLIATGLLLARYLLPRIFLLVSRVPELMIVVAMSWCFGMCGFADALGLSLEMGALVAGVSIASYPYHVDVAAKIAGLRDFFITLFFVSLGLQIPMPTLSVLTLAGVIIVFSLVSRLATIFPALYWMGYGNRTGFMAAVNLSQVSEFSLVLAALGVTYGHVSPNLLSALILALVTTALISSILIPKSHSFFLAMNPLLERLGFKDRRSVVKEEAETNTEVKFKIVILGFAKDGSSLFSELKKRHSEAFFKELLIIDFNPEAHRKLKKQGMNCKYADISHFDTLSKFDLSGAIQIICMLPDNQLKGTSNVKLLKFLRDHAPEAQILMASDNLDNARELYDSGADYVYLSRIVGAHYLADVMERMGSGARQVIRDGAVEFLEKWDEIIR